MKKISVELFWQLSKNDNISPHVAAKCPSDEGVNVLADFTQENLVHVHRDGDWTLCEDIFPISDVFDKDGNFSDAHRNNLENLSNNIERLHMGHSYQIEIREGIITIFPYKFPKMFEIDFSSTLSIKLDDYIKFFRNYVFVLQNKTPVHFDIELGTGLHSQLQ